MPSTSIVARCAFIGLVLVCLVALADGMARAQLRDAVDRFQSDALRAVVRVAGAAD